MELLKLLGILIVIIGFVLKMDSILIIMVAAVVTALVGGMDLVTFLETLGSSFVSNRSMCTFIIVLVVTGTLERNGLKQAAAALMKKFKGASAGMVVGIYGVFRLIFAAFNISFGGSAGFIRPIVMPMAEAAVEMCIRDRPKARPMPSPAKIVFNNSLFVITNSPNVWLKNSRAIGYIKVLTIVVIANFFPKTINPRINMQTLNIKIKNETGIPKKWFANKAIPVVPELIKFVGRIKSFTTKA